MKTMFLNNKTWPTSECDRVRERETCNTYYYCYGITFSLFMRFISQKYAVFIVAVASEWEREGDLMWVVWKG